MEHVPPAPAGPPEVVVLTGDVMPRGMDAVERLARVRYVGEPELAEALPGADVFFMWDFLSDAVAGAWPSGGGPSGGGPGWVHIASAGVERLMFPGLIEGDAVITNSRGIFDEPIAEYVLGLVLAFAKDLHTTVRLQGERRWRHRETEGITGARALVVGTGPIGRAIGRRLSAAGLAVSGVGRTARDADPDLGRVHPMERLDEALAAADYVVLAAPLTPQTRGMIDAAALDRMRPSARLVNVGRGALVAEADLVKALRDKRIAGAALDVFEDEPLPPSSPLWAMPNVIVSPHMSGDVAGWRDELVRLFADNLGRYVAGRPLRNVVDKRLGYVGSSSGSEQRGQP
ncbi:D-2-hydroxyacid dehydrogenase [Actinomadura sp. KC06]|uniref:D-2-hydroxyacid dehydrogenase n=1 Tax=Actinomadura sp. KC06 TaxID=2530369 RepID=UPI001046ED65|nr:D-2-hydroxyacid dehydrogenase [Actinomadura sp. KC06]TDD32142.1 D-2-hydroxyacid dehydrogenase [Actinomadura sp. KC06]